MRTLVLIATCLISSLWAGGKKKHPHPTHPIKHKVLFKKCVKDYDCWPSRYIVCDEKRKDCQCLDGYRSAPDKRGDKCV